MLTSKKVAVVGSRAFVEYTLMSNILKSFIGVEDIIVSGGAIGADSMAQRWAKEHGRTIIIHYPNYALYGRPSAAFVRNRKIAEDADIVLAFYAKGRFQQGGTFHTAQYSLEIGKELHEYEESFTEDSETTTFVGEATVSTTPSTKTILDKETKGEEEE